MPDKFPKSSWISLNLKFKLSKLIDGITIVGYANSSRGESGLNRKDPW